MPLFKSDIGAATSYYADKTVAELLPNHTDEFHYDANYRWALWQPITNRMLGHMWRKVADEHLRANLHTSAPEKDSSLPNLILNPGSWQGSTTVGTWDTLPVGSEGFEAAGDAYLPVFLTDAYGRYGEINGELWDYPIEAMTLFSIPQQLNDAYMAVITGSNTSQDGLGVPYGPEYSLRNGSLGKGVCYAEELTVAYADEYADLAGAAQLLSYADIIEACGDTFGE